MNCETYVLAPSAIAEKARRLADNGLYEQALRLLRANSVEATVYPTRVEMKLAGELRSGRTRQTEFVSKLRMRRTKMMRLSSAKAEGIR